MRRRLWVAAGLVACTFAGAAPALAGDPTAGPGPTPDRHQPRVLHPRDTSGNEPLEIAAPLSSFARVGGDPTQDDVESWPIAPGVTFTKWSQTDARGPINVHLLTIKPHTPGLRIDYASMGPVRQVAPVIKILAKDHAVAGVNGDFYDIGHTGAPLGLGVDRQRGLLHARAEGWNDSFYIDSHGNPEIGELPMKARIVGHPDIDVTNLNSPYVAPGGVGIYTRGFGRTTGYGATEGQQKNVRVVRVYDGKVTHNSSTLHADKSIVGTMLVGRGAGASALKAFKVGKPLRVGYHLEGRPKMAISGNHFLVNDGIIRAVDDRALAPRTAIGIDDDTGEVLILVVDGREVDSRGYTMVELADLMIDLGADEALNLDGGGSSTMVGKGQSGKVKVLNTPSDGFQRWVADAIEVTYKKP